MLISFLLELLQYDDPQDFIKENNLVVQSMGIHIQAVINVLDNQDLDGGTILVPGSHKSIALWIEENARLRKPVPFLTFTNRFPLFLS